MRATWSVHDSASWHGGSGADVFWSKEELRAHLSASAAMKLTGPIAAVKYMGGDFRCQVKSGLTLDPVKALECITQLVEM